MSDDPMRGGEVVRPYAACGAKTRSGEPCRTAPVIGSDRCRMHGGASPQAKAKAAERVMQARLAREVQKLGWEPVVNPALTLADLAGEAQAFKELARAKLNELDEWESFNKQGTETVKAVVAVYTQAIRDVAAVTEKLWRLGIDHKAVQAEIERPSREQAAVFLRVLESSMARAQLDGDATGRLKAALLESMQAEGLL